MLSSSSSLLLRSGVFTHHRVLRQTNLVTRHLQETAASKTSSRRRRLSNNSLLLIAATATAGAGIAFTVNYFHNHFGGTEGLYRAARFYSYAIPRYVVYRYHQCMESPQEAWDELDRETSAIALELMLELKGFYVKSGQICASNIGDAFPAIWQETMAPLQDPVPTEDFQSVILPILNSELDGDFEGTFATFDPVPIGSASIGQVHRARLHDGTPVVVKICYPHTWSDCCAAMCAPSRRLPKWRSRSMFRHLTKLKSSSRPSLITEPRRNIWTLCATI